MTAILDHSFVVTLVEEPDGFGQTMNDTIQGVIVTYYDDDIPDSFLQGLKDCDEGRIIDMENALNDPLPPR